MSNQTNPMAVVRPADDPEMQQWAYEASSAIEAAGKAANTILERYRDAGESLSKAKKKCGHGKWLAWLKRNGITPETASRALRVFGGWDKLVTVTNLKVALKVLAQDGEESEKARPVDVAPLCDRCQRTGPTKDCKACEEVAEAWRRSKKGAGRDAGDDKDAEDEEKNKGKPKPGRVMFEWKATDASVGTLIRQVDQFGNAYKVKEHIEVDSLRKRLADWHSDFKAVYERIAKQKAPEAQS